MPGDVPKVGSLETTPLLRLLAWVSENSFTGVLALVRGETKKSVVFENGKPVAARSNLMQESLGQILVADGKVTQAQVSKSIEITKSKVTKHQGEALLSMGLVDATYLNEMLHRQLLSRIHEVFTWPDGRYGFVTDIPEDIARVSVSESLLEISFRGLVKKYAASPDATGMSSDVKPTLADADVGDIADLKLVGKEMGLLRAITGIATISDLAQKSRLDEQGVKSMLLALRDLGVVRVGESTTRSKIVEMGSSAAAKGALPMPVNASTAASRVGAVAEIHSAMAAIKGKNLFEVLGVPVKASVADVKKAYFDLARKYHPDRLPTNVTPEERKMAESYFAVISDAHAKLANDTTRKEYEATLALEAQGMTPARVNEIMQSEMEYQRGMAMMKKGDFTGASDALSNAVRMYDQEPEYFLNLGWAMFRAAGKTKNREMIQKGKERIEKAISMRENLSQGYYFLGMIAKAEGDLARAAKMFNTTIEVAPRHAEANSELRFINSRKEKQAGGGIKSLFGKKGG